MKKENQSFKVKKAAKVSKLKSISLLVLRLILSPLWILYEVLKKIAIKMPLALLGKIKDSLNKLKLDKSLTNRRAWKSSKRKSRQQRDLDQRDDDDDDEIFCCSSHYDKGVHSGTNKVPVASTSKEIPDFEVTKTKSSYDTLPPPIPLNSGPKQLKLNCANALIPLSATSLPELSIVPKSSHSFVDDYFKSFDAVQLEEE